MNKYTKAEIEIKTGYTLLVSSQNRLAKIIKRFQKCKWNHAGMFIEISGQLFICESKKRGICLTNWNTYLKEDKEYLILKPKFEYNKDKLLTFCIPYCGNVPYDFFNLLFHQPIKFWFNKWIGRKSSKADKRFICGEWVLYIYWMISGNFMSWHKSAPVDIFESHLFKHVEFLHGNNKNTTYT